MSKININGPISGNVQIGDHNKMTVNASVLQEVRESLISVVRQDLGNSAEAESYTAEVEILTAPDSTEAERNRAGSKLGKFIKEALPIVGATAGAFLREFLNR